jgi:hypothetical protein
MDDFGILSLARCRRRLVTTAQSCSDSVLTLTPFGCFSLSRAFPAGIEPTFKVEETAALSSYIRCAGIDF